VRDSGNRTTHDTGCRRGPRTPRAGRTVVGRGRRARQPAATTAPWPR